jgi:phytoene dehydrogenase-like protein
VAGERERPIVVGAGVNGLVAAFYLAREGRAPLVVERASTVGGIASTGEILPGFRASMVAPLAGPLTPRVLADTGLAGHGLEWLESPVRVYLPSAEGRGIALFSDPEKCAAEISRVSPKDAERYREARAALEAMAAFFVRVLETTPPAVENLSGTELFRSARLGLALRRLGKKNMLRALRWLPMPVADLASEWFESEPLRAAVAARGIFAAKLGPRSPGTAARLLFQVAPWGDPFAPVVVPRGGMGALSEALAKAARAAGAQIRTEVEVQRILVKDGRVAGVALAGGEEITGRTVISGADPVRTLVGLIDPAHLSTGVLQKIRHYRIDGSAALVHLALDGLPRFRGLDDGGSSAAPMALAGRIQIGGSVDALERAFDDGKYGRLSSEPFLEVTIPTVLDPSLAPEGKHVLSAWVQFAPCALREGNWTERRDELLQATLRSLENYAPGISSLVHGARVLTPADLEFSYALTGGHVFHGDLAMDQMYSMRPIFGCGCYRGPLPGLYFCGSGTHPGIGVTGASGLNAAREILTDLRRGSS